jgi:DNA replication protein DnaC
MLQPYGAYLGFTNKVFWRRELQRCDCSKAQEYWKEHDRFEEEKKAKEQREEEEKAYQEKLERLMKNSKMGERFKTRTFENFQITNKNEQAFNTIKKYADNFEIYKNKGLGLILTGSYGTGKTHLTAAVCIDLMHKGYQPIFGTMITLLERIKATYDDDYAKENEEQVINQYINCDLLIIDDLGKEKPTEWSIEKLYYIVNARYEKNLPLLITSNYDIEKLKDRLTVKDNFETAEAIVSRIFEMCRGLNMVYEDFRKMF